MISGMFGFQMQPMSSNVAHVNTLHLPLHASWQRRRVIRVHTFGRALVRICKWETLTFFSMAGPKVAFCGIKFPSGFETCIPSILT